MPATNAVAVCLDVAPRMTLNEQKSGLFQSARLAVPCCPGSPELIASKRLYNKGKGRNTRIWRVVVIGNGSTTGIDSTARGC